MDLSLEVFAAHVKAYTRKSPTGKMVQVSEYDRVGGQAGSNPGGLFKKDGVLYYVKTPPTADHMYNEVWTAQLYKLAGANVAEVSVATLNGQPAVASKIIPHVHNGNPQDLIKGGAQEDFAADAWLANWDVVGLDYDNMVLDGPRALRLDTGGGMLYRAQGKAKGAAFGKTVGELETLRDPDTNYTAASVFGGMSKDALKRSIQKVLDIPEGAIRDVVKNASLVRTLLARRDYMRKYMEAL